MTRLAKLVAVVLGLWSSVALAQPTPHRVGLLFPAGADPGARKFTEALAKLGYQQGRNITFHVREAGQHPDRLPQLARELVALRPHVIVSATEPAARALSSATSDIPVVLALIGDPITLGLSTSIARPSRNFTGFTAGHETVAAKRLQLLIELLPSLRKVGLLYVPGNSQNRLLHERTRREAGMVGIELKSYPVRDAREVLRALAQAETDRVGALLVAADPLTLRNRRSIIDECLFRNLPAMHSYAVEVRDGALLSYGSEVAEDFARAAEYVDRIIRGAKVADLPFQEPTQLGLAINLRTAQALGIKIPQSIMVRADEVIE